MNKDKKNKTPRNERNPSYFALAILFVILLNRFLFPQIFNEEIEEVNYSDFIEAVESGEVIEVDLQSNQIVFKIGEDDDSDIFKTGIINDPQLPELLKENNVPFKADIQEPPSILMTLLLSYGVPILIMFLIWRALSRSMSKSMGGLQLGDEKTGTIYVPDGDKRSFDDVAGQDEAKEALLEIVDFLAKPARYKEIGAKVPRGTLLLGPPGTGKTLLARAVAGEAHVPFFSISGSEFVEMFVGRGAARVRELFSQANKKAPCIIFIDEIDAIGKKRDSGMIGGHDEREQTLNQLLAEMDGFESDSGVVILAATNRPDSLDPALLRPGRFDRQIPVELPDLQGRISIFKVHAKNYKLEREIDFDLLGRATVGASGADIANILNEGALRAVRMNRKTVAQEDLEESIEVIIAGHQRKNAILSEHEKKIVAYHEIGHALVAEIQSGTAPVHKITIIPRTSGALGYTMQIDEEEKHLLNRSEMLAKLATFAGGRAAEALVFGEITTGASDDIQRMTKLARAMISQYGMSEEFGMMAIEEQQNIYLQGGTTTNASQETLRNLDKAVYDLVQDSYNRAYDILKDNRHKLDALADFLLKEETITGVQFMEILKNIDNPIPLGPIEE